MELKGRPVLQDYELENYIETNKKYLNGEKTINITATYLVLHLLVRGLKKVRANLEETFNDYINLGILEKLCSSMSYS